MNADGAGNAYMVGGGLGKRIAWQLCLILSNIEKFSNA